MEKISLYAHCRETALMPLAIRRERSPLSKAFAMQLCSKPKWLRDGAGVRCDWRLLTENRESSILVR